MSESFLTSPPPEDTTPVATFSPFVPLLILGLAVLVWIGFQATQLRIERDAMRAAVANQEKPFQDSKKLREALDALARGTVQLANGGNANARLVVDELKRHGVTIDQARLAAPATAPAAVPATAP